MTVGSISTDGWGSRSHLVRAVHQVEGVVRVEDQLSFDGDDHDPAIAFPWMGL